MISFSAEIVSWDGIQIIEDVGDNAKNPGVETLEGRIGPLIKGDASQAHYIEMQGGLFCAEHPHSTESLIYTVRGEWILCSNGRRHVMRPGSLFWFKAGTPTGYEVPFKKPAYILIFKGAKDNLDNKAFFDYLLGMNQKLLQQQEKGTPFKMSDLPEDHQAKIFARNMGIE
jgi:quercetin dioxygenase-like cupin family protein